MNENERQDVCSFCGLPASDGRRLIEGDNCFICETCIGVCYSMLMKVFAKKKDVMMILIFHYHHMRFMIN